MLGKQLKLSNQSIQLVQQSTNLIQWISVGRAWKTFCRDNGTVAVAAVILQGVIDAWRQLRSYDFAASQMRKIVMKRHSTRETHTYISHVPSLPCTVTPLHRCVCSIPLTVAQFKRRWMTTCRLFFLFKRSIFVRRLRRVGPDSSKSPKGNTLEIAEAGFLHAVCPSCCPTSKHWWDTKDNLHG